jgi:hypothetical protein
MFDDSVVRRAVETYPEARSVREYSRRPTWSQAHSQPPQSSQAVLWILNADIQWQVRPQFYSNYTSVHCRFQQWCRDEVLRDVLTDLANPPRDEDGLDESD